MVKVMYNDQLVYKVIIWAFFGISLWKEKVALTRISHNHIMLNFESCLFACIAKIHNYTH